MRIGLLTTSFPRHPLDPAGRFVAELAGWMADQGDEIEVLAPGPARGEHPGVEVFPLRYALRPRLLYGAGAPDNLTRLAAWPQIPLFLGRMTLSCQRRRGGWQAVMSHWILPCGLVAGLAARGLPHLTIAHSSDVHLLRRIGSKRLLGRCLAGPRTGLVLTSESLRGPLHRLAGTGPLRDRVARAPVIPMGVAGGALPGGAGRLRRLRGLEGQTIVLFVGRLVPVKGVDRLVQAVATLPDVSLVVIGDGPLRPSLQQLARKLGARAVFLGQQGGEAKARWLGAADMLALPSLVLPDGRTESAPVVLLEAMAAGLPPIASDVGGVADLIDDGNNGLLVQAGRVGPLRAAIARLSSQPDLARRLARQGLATAARHSWDHVGPRIRDALGELQGIGA